MALVPGHPAEGVGESCGDQEDQEHRQEVRDRRRVLEGVRRVRIEEPATVGAELLDRLLGGHRPERDHLLLALEGRHLLVLGEVLDDPLGDEDEGDDEAQGQEHVQRCPNHVHPEVADRAPGRSGLGRVGRGLLSRESPRKRDRSRHSCGSRHEVVPGEGRHLGEVAHGRLARVGLPVRVGGEARRSVEGEGCLHGREVLRVERQERLEALDRVCDDHGHEAEREERSRVGLPALLRLVDPADLVEKLLEPAERPAQDVALSAEHPVHVGAQKGRQEEHRGREDDNLEPAVGCHRVRTFRGPTVRRPDIPGGAASESALRRIRSSLSIRPGQALAASHVGPGRIEERHRRDNEDQVCHFLLPRTGAGPRRRLVGVTVPEGASGGG